MKKCNKKFMGGLEEEMIRQKLNYIKIKKLKL